MSLLHVLVLLAMLSTVLIAAAKFRQTKYQHNALAFTLSQTGLLLNHAHSYRMANGDWPGSGTNCQLVLNNQEINGFGQIVSCYFPDAGSDLGDRFGLVQWIPNHYVDLFKSRFAVNEVEDFSGARPSSVPAGYSGVVVLTDVNGGTGKRLDLVDFSDIDGGTSTTSELECDGSSAEGFLVVNSFCARVYPQRTVWDDHCHPHVYPASPLVYNGIQLILDFPSSDVESSYLMYRHAGGGHYSDDTYDDGFYGSRCIESDHRDQRYVERPGERDWGDDLINADKQCEGIDTTAAILQACH